MKEEQIDDDELSGYNRDTPEEQPPEAADLKKYYKRVLWCKVCLKVYGTDRTEEFENGICHNCDVVKRRKRRKNGNN